MHRTNRCHVYAPPSRFAYSSSMRSSYNFSAANSASDFVFEEVDGFDVVCVAWTVSRVSEVDGFSVEMTGRGIL